MTNNTQSAIEIFKKCTIREDHRCETDTQKEHYDFMLRMSGDEYRSFMAALQSKPVEAMTPCMKGDELNIPLCVRNPVDVPEEEIVNCALEAGFMLSTEYGQGENQRMPVSNRATLVEFAKRLSTPPQSPVTEEEAQDALEYLKHWNDGCVGYSLGTFAGLHQKTIIKLLQAVCDD